MVNDVSAEYGDMKGMKNVLSEVRVDALVGNGESCFGRSQMGGSWWRGAVAYTLILQVYYSIY